VKPGGIAGNPSALDTPLIMMKESMLTPPSSRRRREELAAVMTSLRGDAAPATPLADSAGVVDEDEHLSSEARRRRLADVMAMKWRARSPHTSVQASQVHSVAMDRVPTPPMSPVSLSVSRSASEGDDALSADVSGAAEMAGGDVKPGGIAGNPSALDTPLIMMKESMLTPPSSRRRREELAAVMTSLRGDAAPATPLADSAGVVDEDEHLSSEARRRRLADVMAMKWRARSPHTSVQASQVHSVAMDRVPTPPMSPVSLSVSRSASEGDDALSADVSGAAEMAGGGVKPGGIAGNPSALDTP